MTDLEFNKEFEHLFSAFIHSRLNQNTVLNEAMKYSLLNGGKRIRPRFALEAAQLVSLAPESARFFAFAIEIAHAYSLVHDDLPCMDNDDFRRGHPTTHRKFGEAQALLAGDALHDFANGAFLECLAGTSTENFTRAYRFFLQSIGPNGMLLGQFDELSVDQSQLSELLRIQSLKTGRLFQAAILCPLLLAGKTNADPLYRDCEQYAEAFGFAFQIADDLEDEAQDQKQGSKNILAHMGRATAIDLAVKKLGSCKVAEKFSASGLLLSKLK